uniref:Uncharacterized protein LOC105107600 n=1 Tax=Rhizophora mucronata TaxID=61149 RepID=A0A2P2JEN1_RHIMU
MNMSASHCTSSGCESGWTFYLGQSSFSKTHCQGFSGFVGKDYAILEDEEEDLSMVSDASSGPPHYYEDCYEQLERSKNKEKSIEKNRSQEHPYLEDTASSHVFSQKVNKKEASLDHVPEFSQGFSATHFKGKSALKKHLGFLQSSFAEKSASKEPGGFQGRNWK